MTVLEATFDNLQALEHELENNLKMGGLFVRGSHGLTERQPCQITLVHPTSGATLTLDARVVWIVTAGDGAGTGVQIEGFDSDCEARIRAFVKAPIRSARSPTSDRGLALNPNERVRNLSASEQRRVAREGDVQERVALERLYGKNVWEALLRNPRLTVPEVSRIARMGNLPTPLIDQIASNAGWCRSAQVRRALLSHPRLSKANARKILNLTPKRELRLIAQQSIYPQLIRNLADQMS